jgi:hypothetical protein
MGYIPIAKDLHSTQGSRADSEPRVSAEARDAWRGDHEQTLRAEEDHPVWRSQSATACSAKTRHPAGAGNQYVLAQLTIDPQPPTLLAR